MRLLGTMSAGDVEADGSSLYIYHHLSKVDKK